MTYDLNLLLRRFPIKFPAMNRPTIDILTARRLILRCQLLDGAACLKKDREGAAQVIERLGYAQIDTINVVERAHHHTLWTRLPDYNPGMLHELQTHDRRVFEYWGHAASYLPMADYRFYLPLMKSFHDPHGKWEKERLQKYGHLMQPIRERIEKEGPLTSSDFELETGKKKEGWWDWHAMKAALELLFWQGELMIRERRNFQRIYDLTERVLPEHVDTTSPTEDELGRFLIERALLAHGIMQEREICNHIHAAGKKAVKKTLKEMTASGEAIEVGIEGRDKSIYYTYPQTLESAGKPNAFKSSVHILSPFDNLIIQRNRLKELFGFEYALECYTPAAKRVHGYFVLPILWGDRFVGRLDPKAERKSKTMIIRNLVFEPGLDSFDSFLPDFTARLFDFARFIRCEKVQIEKVSPAKLKGEIGRQLKRIHNN